MLRNNDVEKIVRDNNWKYISLQDSQQVKFGKMYQLIGFDEKTATYFQGFLSQFAHGLLFSNYTEGHSEQMIRVLYESLPLADRLCKTIYSTFHDQNLISYFIQSHSYDSFINAPDFIFDDLYEFAKTITRNDNTLLID